MSGNDQAFPSLTGLRHTSPSHQKAETVSGLTKRELFAILALQGTVGDPAHASYRAKSALAYADALLAELEKPHA